VQTPTLALIVQRQLEIDNFVPKDSWELRTLYRGTTFTADLPQFATQEEGEAAIAKVKDSEFEVVDVTKKKGTEAPLRLFDLTSL
jgi:DNA topoisomerase-3